MRICVTWLIDMYQRYGGTCCFHREVRGSMFWLIEFSGLCRETDENCSLLGFLTLEDGTDRLSRSVCKEIHFTLCKNTVRFFCSVSKYIRYYPQKTTVLIFTALKISDLWWHNSEGGVCTSRGEQHVGICTAGGRVTLWSRYLATLSLLRAI